MGVRVPHPSLNKRKKYIKHLIELNEEDIREIISKNFSIKKEKVELIPYITTEGSGMSKHDVAKVKVFVEI